MRLSISFSGEFYHSSICLRPPGRVNRNGVARNVEFWTSPNSTVGWRFGYWQFFRLYAEWDFRKPRKENAPVSYPPGEPLVTQKQPPNGREK